MHGEQFRDKEFNHCGLSTVAIGFPALKKNKQKQKQYNSSRVHFSIRKKKKTNKQTNKKNK